MKNHKATLLTVCVLFALLSTQLYSWSRVYAGGDYDYEYGYRIEKTFDGGYLFVSSSLDLFKIGEWGDSLWAWDISGIGTRNFEKTDDSGYIFAGMAGLGLGLARTNSWGHLIWKCIYGGVGIDWGYDIVRSDDGNYLVVGSTESFGTGGDDLWLLKINSDGDTLWARTYGGPYDDEGTKIKKTADGNYIILGVTGTGYYTTAPWLLKIDDNGDTLWTDTCEGSINDIKPTFDGGYIAVGTDTLPYENNLLLLKLDEFGTTVWKKLYKVSNRIFPTNVGECVQQTEDGGYIIAGYTDSLNYDVWLLKTNASGDTLWTKVYGGDDSDYGKSVCSTDDGGYIILGETQSFAEEPGSDLWVIKTDAFGDTLWFGVSPISTLNPQKDSIIHRMVPSAWFRNLSSHDAVEDFYCHCEISSNTFSTSTYHASYWISYSLGLGDSVLIKFPEWISDDSALYTARFYTTCETKPSWSCREMPVQFKGSPFEGINEDRTLSSSFELVRTCGPMFVLRYSNFSTGFQANLFDATGRKVDEINYASPSGTISWGEGEPSGVYFIKLLHRTSVLGKVVITN